MTGGSFQPLRAGWHTVLDQMIGNILDVWGVYHILYCHSPTHSLIHSWLLMLRPWFWFWIPCWQRTCICDNPAVTPLHIQNSPEEIFKFGICCVPAKSRAAVRHYWYQRKRNNYSDFVFFFFFEYLLFSGSWPVISKWLNGSWENYVPYPEQLHEFNYRACKWMLTPVYTSYPEHRERITRVISIVSGAWSCIGFPFVMTCLTKILS